MAGYNTNEVKSAAENLTCSYLEQGYIPAGIYRYSENYYRIRLDNPAPKDGQKPKLIYPLSKNGNGWGLKEPSFPPGGKPLYRKDEIVANSTAKAWVVEGEKCADALAGLGFVAVTSGGSSPANRADWEPLKGRQVVIWPDHDEPGQRYANDVESRLKAIGCHIEKIAVPAQYPAHAIGDRIVYELRRPEKAFGRRYRMMCQYPMPGALPQPRGCEVYRRLQYREEVA